MKATNQRIRFLLATTLFCVASCAVADDYSFAQTQNFKITYEGAKVSDFPLLLKLDETKVPDLYTTVLHAGTDLKFTSPDGGTEYPYEVDTWNPDGTSLVWVKVPNFEKDVQFQMHFGCEAKTSNPDSAQVWTGYAGVWHLNAALDSSGKDLDTDGTTHTTKFFASPAHSVTDAPIGLGYGQSAALTSPAFASKVYDDRNGYKKPMQVSDRNRLSVACWYRPTVAFNNWGTDYNWKTLFGPRNAGNNGWGATWCGSVSKPRLRVENKNGSDGVTRNAYDVPVKQAEWYQFVMVYNGSEQKVYLNGNLLGVTTGLCDDLAWSWTGWMGWGGCVDNTGGAIAKESSSGDFDECRIYDGIVDAARVAADYAVATGDYCEAISAEEPYVTIDSLTAYLPSEFVPETLRLTAVATVHNSMYDTINYHWDLDGDGQFDDLEGTENDVVEIKLDESVTFTPGVKVTVEGTGLSAQKYLDAPIAVRERKIALSLDVSPTVVYQVPETITFSAKAVCDGIEGDLTYIWKTNDVEIARTAESSYQFVHSVVSSFLPSVTVAVEGIEYSVTAVGEEVHALTAFYVDSAAEAGGDGSQESPFCDLSNALARVAYARAIYLKGSFALPTNNVALALDRFALAKWGDESDPKPVLSCSDNEKAPTEGVFTITGQDVTISDISFRYPSTIHEGGSLVSIKANGTVIRGCDFELSNKPTKACYNGVITGDANFGWTVDGCSFKGFGPEDASIVYRVLNLCGAVNVTNSRFEECASILYMTNNPWNEKGVTFVSNCVYNSTAALSTNVVAGAVASCEKWKFCQGLTIAHNVLVNDKGRNAGCIATIRGESNPFQNGPLAVYNNTVAGYDALVAVDALTLPDSPNNRKTVFQIFNNLCDGAIPMFVDNQESWQIKENASFIRNNVQTGGSVFVVPNYTLTEHATVADNMTIPVIKFCSTDPTEPDFYRPKTSEKKGTLMSGGWSDGDKYPAYIGAIRPEFTSGMAVFIR